jgi:hypothetical protein
MVVYASSQNNNSSQHNSYVLHASGHLKRWSIFSRLHGFVSRRSFSNSSNSANHFLFYAGIRLVFSADCSSPRGLFLLAFAHARQLTA